MDLILEPLKVRVGDFVNDYLSANAKPNLEPPQHRTRLSGHTVETSPLRSSRAIAVILAGT